VAIQAGDRRGRFTRQIEEDRGDRAAVLRAIVDAGEHDDRRRRGQRERERQEECDRRDRSQTRQHADRRAEQHAGQTRPEVLRREGRGESEPEMIETDHVRSPARA
jgi:hypothetical protein